MRQLASIRGSRVAGIDEAGRGPLAGPVVAAAVILDERRPVDGLADSLDKIYPHYGFCRHKGYATVEHRQQILRHGPCRQHRMSFRPFCIPN